MIDFLSIVFPFPTRAEPQLGERKRVLEAKDRVLEIPVSILASFEPQSNGASKRLPNAHGVDCEGGKKRKRKKKHGKRKGKGKLNTRNIDSFRASLLNMHTMSCTAVNCHGCRIGVRSSNSTVGFHWERQTISRGVFGK